MYVVYKPILYKNGNKIQFTNFDIVVLGPIFK